MSFPHDGGEAIAELVRRVAELERRARNRRRTGTVKEIDYEKGLYRVLLSEQAGKPFLSDWIKPRQMGAGAFKADILLTEDEQVDVVSESGDMTDAMIEMSAYSDTNKRKNTDTPVHLSLGAALITMAGDKIVMSVGATSLTLTAGEAVLATPKFTGLQT